MIYVPSAMNMEADTTIVHSFLDFTSN